MRISVFVIIFITMSSTLVVAQQESDTKGLKDKYFSAASSAPTVPAPKYKSLSIFTGKKPYLRDAQIPESTRKGALILKKAPPVSLPKMTEKGAGMQKAASSDLFLSQAYGYMGLPYVLGGDGIHSTDCGMLTRMALIGAGLADEDFPRRADFQYRLAEAGEAGLALVSSADKRRGDLVFMNWGYDDPDAYGNIQHVAIYLGSDEDGYIYVLHASSGRGEVCEQWVNKNAAVAYGRLTK